MFPKHLECVLGQQIFQTRKFCEKWQWKRSFQRDTNTDITSHLLRWKDCCPGEKKCKRCSMVQHENIPILFSLLSICPSMKWRTNRGFSFFSFFTKEEQNSDPILRTCLIVFDSRSPDVPFLNCEGTENTNSTETSLMSTLFVPYFPSWITLTNDNYSKVQRWHCREQIHYGKRGKRFNGKSWFRSRETRVLEVQLMSRRELFPPLFTLLRCHLSVTLAGPGNKGWRQKKWNTRKQALKFPHPK